MAINFRIGELARRSGRSQYTIRWYEAQGLMPGVVRDTGGRRVYVERHVAWLDLVDRLRGTGMSIAQLRDYATLVKQGKVTLAQQKDLLSTHRARVKQAIAQWTRALKLIDGKIDYYGLWLKTGQRPVASQHERIKFASSRSPQKPPSRSGRS
jgi:DNA-binding transcriptional MerR regulator